MLQLLEAEAPERGLCRLPILYVCLLAQRSFLQFLAALVKPCERAAGHRDHSDDYSNYHGRCLPVAVRTVGYQALASGRTAPEASHVRLGP